MVLHSRRHGRIAVVRFVLLAFYHAAVFRGFALSGSASVVEQLEFGFVLRARYRLTRWDSRRPSS